MEVKSKYLDDYRKMQRSDFTYFLDIATRWGDEDPFGHINNTIYARYYESARIDYSEKNLQLTFSAGSKDSIITADLQIAYLQQLHYPSDIEVGSRISSMGNSSLVMDAAIFLKGSDKLINTSRAILVWFDFKANKPKRIPQKSRELIFAFEKISPA